MRRRLLLVGGILWLAGCWTEEGTPNDVGNDHPACADLACSDMLTIHVGRLDGEIFEPGEYFFTLDQEHPIVTCIISAEGDVSCTGDTNMMAVTLDEGNETFDLRFDAVPQEIYVEVHLDGGIIGTELLIPDYNLIVSQNPDCTDTCMQGSATMTVQSEATDTPALGE